MQSSSQFVCLAISLLNITLLVGCAAPPVDAQLIVTSLSRFYTAVGSATTVVYKDYPPPQQRLLAIRAARLDAYRNLAEALYGLRIRGGTDMTNAKVEIDRSRSYVDALVRGARVKSITPKPDGIYEVEVELLPDRPLDCLYASSGGCMAIGPAEALPKPVLYPETSTYAE